MKIKDLVVESLNIDTKSIQNCSSNVEKIKYSRVNTKYQVP